MLISFRSAVLPLTVLLALILLLYSRQPLLSTIGHGTHTNVGTSLRILPLGDSITEGYGSTDHNGWRLALRNMLIKDGYVVEYIGTLMDGMNNPDTHHEGWGAHDIDQIYQRVTGDNVLDQKPSLVLLHAGTNDIDRSPPSAPYETAPDRLEKLIDLVLERCPNATVLVATIIQDDHTGAQARADVFNAAIPGLVASKASQHKIRVVHQKQIGGKDLVDLIHPTDAGYKKMASNWFNAIRQLPEGWL